MKDILRGPNLVLRSLWAVIVMVVLISSGNLSAQDGEALFRANCSSCHKIDENMTGPALQGATSRWKGKEELLYKWVKDPAAVKEMGDPYVTKLLAEWESKAGLMTAQAVSDEEIAAIFEYVDTWTPPVPDVPLAAGPVEVAEKGLSTTWLLIIFFILLILVFSLLGVRSSLSRLNASVAEAEGGEHVEEPSFNERAKQWVWENKVFVSITSILVVVYLAVVGYGALMEVGVYQGYTPEQPIKFNHTLHAGDNGIACVYCHSSALKSKHAGIPSANICMNCHKSVSKGRTDDGTAEIAKIYAAVGWDKENQEYTGEEQPIKWVKVHNLPDHAYFNHQQHYVVGQIECQECHGEVQEDYTVAGQHAPLTMGWCIDCHNRTQVAMDGNAYYDEIHERLVENGKEELKKYLEDGSITARELGGWECSKCHY